jgi:hypothetical protein
MVCSYSLLRSALPAPTPKASSSSEYLNFFISYISNLSSIPVLLCSMSKAFYITSVSNGLVLADQPSGTPSGVVVENRGDSDREKWIVEAGDEPNVIALKSASNGQYLHADGGRNYAAAGTGGKQWWKMSSDDVTAPGACRLSPVEYPNFFLNHFQGKPARRGRDQIKVHMWKWEASRIHAARIAEVVC